MGSCSSGSNLLASFYINRIEPCSYFIEESDGCYSGMMFEENRRECGKWMDLAQVLFSDRLWCKRCWSLRVLPLLSQIN
jgi:hypothetical protein